MTVWRLVSGVILCVLAAGCGVKGHRFELPPGNYIEREFPWRVGVITEKAFTPFIIKFGYWSAPGFTMPMHGLPDAYAAALRRHFRAAETLPPGRGISPERHDLVATMSVDQLHFDGARTSIGRDQIDLTMTFSVAQPNGGEVFRATISSRVSGYSLSRWGTEETVYMRPRPQNLFRVAFLDVFEELSSQLKVADIKVASAQ